MLRIEQVAKRTGYTLSTLRSYSSDGILPPPRKRIGTTMLFAAADIDFFMKTRKTARGPYRRRKRR